MRQKNHFLKNFSNILIILFALKFNKTSTTPQTAADMYKTKTNLFQRIAPIHDRYIPPLYPNHTDVSVRIWPLDLRNFDSLKQTIELKVWLQLEWYDWRLEWDLNDTVNYPAPKFLVRIDEIWTPPLDVWERLVDSSESQPHMYYSAHIKVRPTGRVRSDAYYVDKMYCPMRVRLFPFDEQQCVFTLVAFHGTRMSHRLRFDTLEKSTEKVDEEPNAFASGEWLLYANTEIIRKTLTEFQVSEYTDEEFGEDRGFTGEHYLTYTFYLRRKPEQHIFVWVVPPILLSVSSVISMYLGCEKRERYGFGGAVMITLTLMLSELRQSLAIGTDGYPVLGYMYAGLILSMILATVLSPLPEFVESRQEQQQQQQEAQTQTVGAATATRRRYFKQTTSAVGGDASMSNNTAAAAAAGNSTAFTYKGGTNWWKVVRRSWRFTRGWTVKKVELILLILLLAVQAGFISFAFVVWWPWM